MKSDVRTQGASEPRCPFCGHGVFVSFKKRPSERCEKCKTSSRVRANWVLLNHLVKVDETTRIAHFAPEKPIAVRLRRRCGDNYHPFDLNNDRYEFGFPVRKLNMCTDLESIPREHYDVVLHTHVLEHVPCNYTIVLQNLHALLKPGGFHIFSFPIGPGHYREDQSPLLSEDVRKATYGLKDHVRRFGRDDFVPMVGCIFGITENYSLTNFVPGEVLERAGISSERWTLQGLGPVLVVPKQ